MIEVLVAIAVLAIGLLGIAALQIQGVRYNYGSYARSQAVALANDYIERMYANRPGVNAGEYGEYDSADQDCDSAPAAICSRQADMDTPDICSSEQMATYDRFIMACGHAVADGRHGGANNLLPSGRMTVTCIDIDGAAATCASGLRHVITMNWQERSPESSGASELQTVNYQVTIQP